MQSLIIISFQIVLNMMTAKFWIVLTIMAFWLASTVGPLEVS